MEDFKANVRVGAYGSGKEQPFRAARLALSDRMDDGTNASFLRPDARLAIVFVSDEDDCTDTAEPLAGSDTQCHDLAFKDASLDPVDGFVDFLRGPLGGELRDVVVASIVGVDAATGEPSCQSCSNTACGTAFDGADRFGQLEEALGTARTRIGSICDPSFQSILEDIAGLLVAQSMPLDGTPADWRMLAVGVDRADAATIPCAVALDGVRRGGHGRGRLHAAPRRGARRRSCSRTPAGSSKATGSRSR